jgi:osmotically-inducible protein OsmY
MFEISGPTQGDAYHRHAATIAAIESALASAADVDATAITVSMADGLVMLDGAAPSEGDIDRAMNIATLIAGGVVRNRIWRRA